MTKKTLAWITLASFLVFSWSCYGWQAKPLQSINPEKREGTKVSTVQTKSGKRIYINTNPAAIITADTVVGEKPLQHFAIEKSKIEKPKDLNVPTPFILTTTDRNSYRVKSWTDMKNREDRIIINGYLSFSMPLSAIDLVWIKKANVPAIVLLIVISVAYIVANVIVLSKPWGDGNLLR
jgi:hypothetical protein